MTVYVDGARNRLGRMVMSHLLSNSLDELNEFAQRIGLKREWLHTSRSGVPHYDLCKNTKLRAVVAGAVQIDRRSTANLCAWWRTQGGKT